MKVLFQNKKKTEKLQKYDLHQLWFLKGFEILQNKYMYNNYLKKKGYAYHKETIWIKLLKNLKEKKRKENDFKTRTKLIQNDSNIKY